MFRVDTSSALYAVCCLLLGKRKGIVVNKKVLATTLALVCGRVVFGVEVRSPDYPFVPKPVKTCRLVPIVEDGRIVCGTKVLNFINDGGKRTAKSLRFTIDDKPVFEVRYQSKPSHPTWHPFVSFERNEMNDGRFVRSHRFATSKDGSGGEFRQIGEVRDGKAVVTSQYIMDAGAVFREQVNCLDLPVAYVAGAKIVASGANGRERIFKIPTVENWMSANPKGDWKGIGSVEDPVRIAVRTDEPARAFVLEFAPGTHSSAGFHLTPDGVAIHFGTPEGRLGHPFAFALDFGECEEASAGECVVNNTNFTRNNDYEFAYFDEKRNLLVNPSFESGTRYYHNMKSGTDLRDLLVEGDAHSGRYAFCLGEFNTLSVPTRANKPYTVSFYAKSTDGRKHTIGAYVWTYAGQRENEKFKKKFSVAADGDWRRLAWTFKYPYNALAIRLLSSENGVLVDDMQFEEGEEATEYAGNRMGVDLKTDALDNHYANVGERANVRFVVRGPNNVKGTLSAEVVDFFGRSTWKGDLMFALGTQGESETGPIPETAFAARGVYVIRMTVRPEGLPSYRDFFRLARFAYSDGTEKNRLMHMTPNLTWGSASSELATSERNFRRALVTGSTCALNVVEKWNRVFTDAENQKVLERYAKVAAFTREDIISPLDRKEMEKRGLGDPWKVTEYSPEMLAYVEEKAYEKASKYPFVEIWDVGNETSGKYATACAQKYDEFARYSLAIQRGIHRANPSKIFCAYGTCNNSEQGRREIRDFLAAWRRISPDVPPSMIIVHPYRPDPDAPDLDADFKALFRDLDRAGYPDIPIYADEGAYFYPLVIDSWNGVAPWMGTQAKDKFSFLHVPSYDLGWGERIGAAFWIRYVFTGYKYMPRLKCLSCWGKLALDVDDPIAQFVANAAMAELAGNAVFRRDIRFAPGSRAYILDDGMGRALGVFWRYTAGMDRGTENGNSLALDLSGLDARLFDMMGNEVSAPKDGDGRTVLPLGAFPVYVRTDLGRMGALAEAFEGAKTDVKAVAAIKLTVPKLFAPKVRAGFDWNEIPGMEIPYVLVAPISTARKHPARWEGRDDLSATYRFAWDDENLYLRVETKDDVFAYDLAEKRGPSSWYKNDSVQLFFDTFCDARKKFAEGYMDHDENDMSYELLPTNDTAAVVFRRTAPDFQLTGGVVGGLLGNRLEPAVPCEFKWDKEVKARTYTVRFPRRYVQPIPIEKGARFGFCIYVIDRDDITEPPKLYLSNVDPAKGSSDNPYLYTEVILSGDPRTQERRPVELDGAK